MDLSELIKSYTPEQKNMFTAFCINWPLAFTVMYVFSSNFKNHTFLLQLIFSASATIIVEIFTFFSMIIIALSINELGSNNFRIRKFMWLPCLVCPGAFLAIAMLYRAGKDSVLAEILILESIFTFASVFTGMISFAVFDFVKNKRHEKDRKGKNVENGKYNRNISEDRLEVPSDRDGHYQNRKIKYIYKENR